MRILYVSQHFPPEMGAGGPRAHELSKYWVQAGHDVTVLTGFPNHPTGVVPREYRGRMWKMSIREWLDGIEVVRTWLYPAPNRRAVERIFNYGSFCLSASVRGLFLKRPDVVIGTSPQLLIALSGWWISHWKRCPFIFEVRDLWPESLLASGMGRESSLLIHGLERLAAFLYHRCDRIVVVTEAFRENLIATRGLSAGKIDVVENGVETDTFVPAIQDGLDLRRSHGLCGKFVASYIGTIGYAHGLEVILNAARNLKELQPEVLFLLVGEGAERERLQSLAEQEGLTNIRFMGQQPRERIPSLINASDVCMVMLRKAEVFKTVIPSKMLEFMACGRPVVLGVDGQARKILEEAQAGIPIAPGDADALVQVLTELRRDPALGTRLGKNGQRFIQARYSRKRKARDYLSILEKLVESRTNSAGGAVTR